MPPGGKPGVGSSSTLPALKTTQTYPGLFRVLGLVKPEKFGDGDGHTDGALLAGLEDVSW